MNTIETSQNATPDNFRIFLEEGIHWAWFTELNIIDEDHVEIVAHHRLHYNDYDDWLQKYKNAKTHPGYYGTDRMRYSEEGRILTHYNLPSDNTNDKCRWCEVTNPKDVFEYPIRK
jgi:hypothetical protein